MKIKEIISFMAAAALAAAALPAVNASEITDTADAGYAGAVWQEIKNGDEFRFDNSAYATIEADTKNTIDGNGSAKITWTATDKSDINIRFKDSAIPKEQGKAVKAVSVDVYVPETINGAANKAVGTTMFGYAIDDAGRELNGFYNSCEPRNLSAGWNTIVFDTVNGKSFPFIVWKNASKSGVIYLDNVRVYYQTPSSVFDSFENYDEDWKKGDLNLSKNTNPAYIKDGKASMKIECDLTGEKYAFKSKFLNLPNINGKQVPQIEGYTPTTFGFWVYSDGAIAQFKPQGTESWQYITEPGWTYVSWNIPASAKWDNWNIDHFNQMVLKVTKLGTLYIDAMSIGYLENSANENEVVLDSFEAFYWNAGGCYKAAGYGKSAEVKQDGLYSGKFVIPARKNFDDGEYVYSNNGFGITIPQIEGKAISKIGMWVHGTGVEGTYLRPGFHTGGDDASTEYRPFGEIDLNFEGWKYIETNVSSETLNFYDIQGKNNTDTDMTFYVDKIVAKYIDLNTSTDKWTGKTEFKASTTDSGAKTGELIFKAACSEPSDGVMNFGMMFVNANDLGTNEVSKELGTLDAAGSDKELTYQQNEEYTYTFKGIPKNAERAKFMSVPYLVKKAANGSMQYIWGVPFGHEAEFNWGE